MVALAILLHLWSCSLHKVLRHWLLGGTRHLTGVHRGAVVAHRWLTPRTHHLVGLLRRWMAVVRKLALLVHHRILTASSIRHFDLMQNKKGQYSSRNSLILP